METKQAMIIGGEKNTGGTCRIYDAFWRLKDGTGWRPNNWGSDERFEEDGDYEKWYLAISSDVACGGPEPFMIKAENVQVMEK